MVILPLTTSTGVAGADSQHIYAIDNNAEVALFVPGEIIVKFKHGIPDKAIEAVNAQHGASVVEVSPLG
jgi:hypothetical protein